MNIRIGTTGGDQIDSLSTKAVPTTAMGDTVTPPVLSGTLASLPENFLVIDEHAADSDNLLVGDHMVTLLPTGARIPSVIAAVVARGLNGDDTYVSSSLMPRRVYLDSSAGTGVPLDAQVTAVNQALARSGARVMTYDAYLAAEHSQADQQTNNAAVVILGIALAYALIAVANTLIMAMSGRRREFALLGLAGATRGQIVKVCAAESAVAVVVGTVLAAVATVLAAVTQRASLSKLVATAPTVIPWTQIWETVAICALVTVATASGATCMRRRAIEAAGIRE
ncbi:MAG: transporter permease [Actinomycetia bacterium]|nr:transporter permease [Actinomycetes bacterium]